jgi:hypothetical protein
MFRYELAEGAEGKAGKGGLVWMKQKSSFSAEPKVRVLRDQWDLAKKVFDTGE